MGYPITSSGVLGSHIQAQGLDSISTRGARVVFTRDAQQHFLRTVRLLTVAGRVRRGVRMFTLDHSYFVGQGAWLCLDRIRESNSAAQLPPYVFQYNTSAPIPVRGTSGQDHWGYYNGANSNTGLLPDPRLLGFAAKRSPNLEFAAAGALRRMTFPTGGYTNFDYEGGTYAAAEARTSWRDTSMIAYNTSPYHPNTTRLRPQTFRQVGGLHGDSAVFNLTDYKQAVFRSARTGINGTQNHLPDMLVLRRTPRTDTIVAYLKPLLVDTARFVGTLAPGVYTVWALCEPNEGTVDLTLSFRTPPGGGMYTVAGPGVRVRQTTTVTAGAPPLVHTYEYTVDGPQGTYSSGMTLLEVQPNGDPVYASHPYTEQAFGGPQTTDGISTCDFEHTSSDNTFFGAEYSKYSFYYQRVTERTGTGRSAGATVSCFQHRPEQFNDVLPTERATYRKGAGTKEQVVQRERYHYRSEAPTLSFHAIRPWLILKKPPGLINNGPIDGYAFDQFDLSAAFVVPDTTILVRYSEGGDSVVQVTATGYRDRRPVRMATQADGKWAITKVKRLADYRPALSSVTALRVNGFNPIMETQTWQRPAAGADSVLVGGQLTFFDPARHPAGSWALRLDRPAARPNAEALANGAYTTFKSDTRYYPTDSVRYDPATSLLLERRPTAAPPTAYLWGYNRGYVVAQVQNASYAQVLAVLGQPTIDRLRGPNPGTDAAVQAALQPLRTQLPLARVTTFTHAPLVGMTSQTDPSGRTTTYEYNALGRLLRVRDERGRVLTQQQYRYGRP